MEPTFMLESQGVASSQYNSTPQNRRSAARQAIKSPVCEIASYRDRAPQSPAPCGACLRRWTPAADNPALFLPYQAQTSASLPSYTPAIHSANMTGRCGQADSMHTSARVIKGSKL